MKTAVKALFAAGLVIGAGVAAVGATYPAPPVPKDQARILSEAGKSRAEEYSRALLQLTQATRPRPDVDAPVTFVPMRAGDGGPHMTGPRGVGRPPPAHFGPLGGPPGPFAAVPPFAAMGPNRFACEEDIDRHAALAGYLKSRLRLEGAQKEAWRKIEQAAEPVVEKMQKACASLPAQPGEPPNFAAMIEMADQQFSLRAEFVHAIIAPARALYDTLSSEQRRVLDRPPPPML